MTCPANVTCLNSVGAASQLFSSALQFFTLAQCLITEDWPPQADVNNYDDFDFIIIGAGSAGSVVANRLSEVKKWNVLLIEAGGDPPAESIIPQLDSTLIGTEYDWQYQTEDDGRINKALTRPPKWPRGKMLGGCSSINGMFYFRGAKSDYQTWYDDGNVEWHPDGLEKYFKKAENLQNQKLLKDPKIKNFYGREGYLVLNTFNSTYRDINDLTLEAWNEIGFNTVSDINVANIVSKAGIARMTAANGQRESTAKGYLNTIKGRKNLKILKHAFVEKILIDSSKRARGVKVEYNNKKIKFHASKEVIVSGGAINTPQLLMLSGVGPEEDLNANGIQCKVNLPAVGQNLQDHLIIPIPVFADKPGELDENRQMFEDIQYLYNRTGYLAQNSISDIAAFYSSSENAVYPEFQAQLVLYWKNSSLVRLWAESVGYKKSVVDSYSLPAQDHSMYLFLFTVLHPHSKGNITLVSNDPKDHPSIYSNIFSDSRDLDLAAKGIKLLTKVVDTEYFKSINGYLGRIDWPACNCFELDSEEYWKCISLDIVASGYHLVGTAKMGTDPSDSVVDSRLRVHGISNLRVIDASVMPGLSSGNTNGPVVMIAERASDLIKEDHGVRINKFH